MVSKIIPKAIRKITTCLFCKADLFPCCKGNKSKNNGKVSSLEMPSFWKYKENYVTRNRPEKFRDFRETGPCFSKVPKLFGPISGATIPFISPQHRGSKPSNFAILFLFLILKTSWKISFSKQVDCSLTSGFSRPKSSQDFRETGPTPLGAQHLKLKIKLMSFTYDHIQQGATLITFRTSFHKETMWSYLGKTRNMLLLFPCCYRRSFSRHSLEVAGCKVLSFPVAVPLTTHMF